MKELKAEIVATAICSLLMVVIITLCFRQVLSFLGSHLTGIGLFSCAIMAMPLLYYGVFNFSYYTVLRFGYLLRKRRLREPLEPDVYVSAPAVLPSVTVLIPSYKEEIKVVMQTIASAALMEYSSQRIVLLLDDPPDPVHESDRLKIQEARQLPSRLAVTFARMRSEVAQLRNAVIVSAMPEHEQIALLYDKIGALIESIPGRLPELSGEPLSHTDRLFQSRIVQGAANRYYVLAQRIRCGELKALDTKVEWKRIDGLFSAEFSCFERKIYENLSHESNKAMNLNAYLSLIGGRYRREHLHTGLHLVPCARQGDAHWSVPDTDYVVVLDADTLLLWNYLTRFVTFIEQPSSQRIALIQSPYTSFPGAPTAVERIAGAATDIQYIAAQGMTHFNSAQWGGPNCLIRMGALRDIKDTILERGHAVGVFVQNKTVIEDAGSTIHFLEKGWRVHSSLEQLSFSATPPDFGALVVQRERWANGGLIILGDLIQYAIRQRSVRPTFVREFMLRFHHLTANAANSLMVVLALLSPGLEDTQAVFFLCTAVPYLILMCRDLKIIGSSRKNAIKILSLNTLLLSTQITGTLLSIYQIITGERMAFKRTPKVLNRTSIAPRHLMIISIIMVLYTMTAIFGLAKERYLLFVSSGFVAALMAWGIKEFIGYREFLMDLGVPLAPLRRSLYGPIVAASVAREEQ